jgi:hypothetical protein
MIMKSDGMLVRKIAITPDLALIDDQTGRPVSRSEVALRCGAVTAR